MSAETTITQTLSLCPPQPQTAVLNLTHAAHTRALKSHHDRQKQSRTGAVSTLRCCCCCHHLLHAIAHAATCSGLLALASALAVFPCALLSCCNCLQRHTQQAEQATSLCQRK
jgi:hypothetical protein